MQFAVARALEFFKDHFVHAAAGVDQCSGDDGQRTTFFHIAGGARSACGRCRALESTPPDSTLPDEGHDVVSEARARRVMESSRMTTSLAQFHQALGALDLPFRRHAHVAGSWLVEGGGNDFALDRALHFPSLLPGRSSAAAPSGVRPGMIGGEGVGNALHHHGLAALGRRQSARAGRSQWGDDVDDAAGDVLFTLMSRSRRICSLGTGVRFPTSPYACFPIQANCR